MVAYGVWLKSTADKILFEEEDSAVKFIRSNNLESDAFIRKYYDQENYYSIIERVDDGVINVIERNTLERKAIMESLDKKNIFCVRNDDIIDDLPYKRI